MKKFYFSFGTSNDFPFKGGYLVIEAPNKGAATQIFKAYFPCKKEGVLNCSWVYPEESFMEDWDWCWSKSKCHAYISYTEGVRQ